MRICISVTNDVYTDQRVNRTACSFIKAGHQVQVIGRLRSVPVGNNALPYPVKRFRLLINKGPLFYAVYNLRLFFYLLTVKADLFMACDLDTLLANYLTSKIRKKSLVFDSHEYFTEVPELVGRPVIKKIWTWLEGLMLPDIQHACTVSQSIAATYQQKYGIKMEVIRNLPSSIRPEIPVRSSLRSGEEKIILYQGSLNLGRGLELAIRAMKQTPDARLVVIGDGDIRDKLIRLAENEGLSDVVDFPGRIMPDELFALTAQADLGISLEADLGLNYRYALPNKLFDYIQAGVPVLVSDLPEMAALVKQYDIGKSISTSNPDELASCFQSMLNSTEDRRRWKNNLKKAASELCWEKEEAKLLTLIRNASAMGH